MPILSLKLMDASGLAMTDQTVRVLRCAALCCAVQLQLNYSGR